MSSDGTGLGRGGFVMEQYWLECYESVFPPDGAVYENQTLLPTSIAAEVTFLCHFKPLHSFALDEIQCSDWFRALGMEPFQISRLPS